ncbi:MAG TPA: GDSL-type esterase/lipase family protein [Flavitalea sp.]|nr:GDSL-type esterase/lipase family protein [Flavitalea sp.]
MSKFYRLTVTLCVISFCQVAVGQHKIIAVIGSSTAAGTGATSPDSSWVRRLGNYYKELGILDTIYNRARGGYNCYHGMPANYTPPPYRPSPVPDSNITKAISFAPHVVLISFVTNNYDVYSTEEIKASLFTMYESARNAGKIAFVSTTQPRTGFSADGRLKLRKLKDSIIKWFGYYAINFWNPVADSSDNTIAAPYRSSADDIHLNNAGHRLLFQQVVAKNIFNQLIIPVKVAGFCARLENNAIVLKWFASCNDLPREIEVQKSENGIDFVTVTKTKTFKGDHHYTYVDKKPLQGKNYYRLRFEENNLPEFSVVVSETGTINTRIVAKLFPVPAHDYLKVFLKGTSHSPGKISIITIAGQPVRTFTPLFQRNETIVSLPVASLAPGIYFVQISNSTGQTLLETFEKN